jgi:hypothetical protein
MSRNADASLTMEKMIKCDKKVLRLMAKEEKLCKNGNWEETDWKFRLSGLAAWE